MWRPLDPDAGYWAGRLPPPEDVPLVLFMVDHERSVMRMAEREAAGESVMDRELLVMLAYPIPRESG